MNAWRQGLISGLVVVLLLFGGWAWYHYWSPWRQSKASPSVIAVSDFDAFQKNLADRVSKQFGVNADSVVVAPAAYDLGWLLDSVQTYPADRTDCVPNPTPLAIAAPHLFPSYRLASNTAATMTLGSDALQQLTNASLGVSHQADLEYSIDNVQVLLMDLKTVDQVTRTGECGDYVSKHPKSRLIRGLVLGKVSFRFATDNPISAEAKLPKIGGISAKSNPNNSTVTVTDDQPSQILEMVSILGPEPIGQNTASVTPQVTPPPALVPTGGPHVFLQQDKADEPNAGSQIAAKLQANWPGARVETKVERIPTSKMPSTPQVRFFNAGDQALANTCRDRLKAATGIEARVVRIGLVAPAGQLEVWLQKVATPQ